MTLKPWREVAVPHEDVLKGTFQQAEFAADLSRVHEGTATSEYQNPDLFFKRTFITEGMRLLLDSVVKRLSGKGGDPVIQLQTAFGGGKTHTMLAVYHLAKGDAPVAKLQGIEQILSAAKVASLPKANIVVLDGIRLSPNQPQKRGKISVRTIWGELAWQLGKESAYEQLKDADASGTSPGKELLAKIIAEYAPCVILIDELVAYIRQFSDGKSFSGGTYESNLSFIQALTEAVKAVPTAVLLASLPESDKEAGGQRGVQALNTLAHYFGRVQALWKPVATEEAFEIVRRRLFTKVSDHKLSENVCRAFADAYVENSDELPQETQESRYFERLMHAYPIHPEVFDRLYEDWSSLENFQRTRGVLKLMAKVIHRLWVDGNNDMMIMPGSIPLYDGDTRNEVINYLAQGWDPVLERDIDGEKAETTEIEKKDTRLGSLQACRRVARTIFLGSAPTTPNQMVRGLETKRVVLGCVQPGQQVGVFKDSLRRLTDRLHYLNIANERCWFDVRPNLRKEMEERKRRFNDQEDVLPAIRARLQQTLGAGAFGGVHVFTASGDIPDDKTLRLVALPPTIPFSRQEERLWRPEVDKFLKQRGDQPRQKQNRLIFLASEFESVNRLNDQVRSVLAWESIVSDYRENKLVLDNLMAKNAEGALAQAKDALHRMIREAYKWLLVPMQEQVAGKGVSEIIWEHFPLNPGSPGFAQEIERVLKEGELLITEWAPIHLSKVLKTWFWKDGKQEASALDVWEKMCNYLYLPRLKDDGVYKNTILAGASSFDFYGVAQGRDGDKYVGFSFGQATYAILDSDLLLIEPTAATEQAKKIQPVDVSAAVPGVTQSQPTQVTQATTKKAKKHFYGMVDLHPVLAKKQFADLVDEVAIHFTSDPSAEVKIKVEIVADSKKGFTENVQRTVKENSKQLNLKIAEFEDGV
ncbi:MAG TPA: DUF499 domain-containing protein [Candidatus Omnitrophota bacterium]|nr:DUF499 domain-containing protein [Candidatus Omnitrophota bacterium]